MEPSADPVFDASAAISSALNQLSPELYAVTGPVLIVAAGIFALTKGWGLVKRFI